MTNTVIGLAIIALGGAWVSFLAALAYWAYTELGALPCGILAAGLVVAFVAFVFWREIWQERNR